jgi:hypothetical protein
MISMTARLTGTAPVLLVKDVVKAAAHWGEKLGFSNQEMFGSPPNFCMARRDDLTIMLAQVGHGVDVRPHWTVVGKLVVLLRIPRCASLQRRSCRDAIHGVRYTI